MYDLHCEALCTSVAVTAVLMAVWGCCACEQRRAHCEQRRATMKQPIIFVSLPWSCCYYCYSGNCSGNSRSSCFYVCYVMLLLCYSNHPWQYGNIRLPVQVVFLFC